MTDASERFASFHARREAQVKEPMGSLALILTQWIDAPQEVWGVAGRWAPRGDNASGLELTASAEDGIQVNGRLIDGTVLIDGPGIADPATIIFSDTLRGSIIREGNLSGLRVWDERSEWIQNYGGIDAYDYDPAWVITAQWKPNPAGTTALVAKKTGEAKDEIIPGEIAFSHEGNEVSLVTIGTGRALQIVFADETNDSETYSVGRFLFVVPNPDGSVTLDFNLAVLPPCAFSYNFNCPIPPKQNRLPFPIRAGEKNAVTPTGELLHH
jgi:uncharacterized protein (DUF1684 family)